MTNVCMHFLNLVTKINYWLFLVCIIFLFVSHVVDRLSTDTLSTSFGPLDHSDEGHTYNKLTVPHHPLQRPRDWEGLGLSLPVWTLLPWLGHLALDWVLKNDNRENHLLQASINSAIKWWRSPDLMRWGWHLTLWSSSWNTPSSFDYEKKSTQIPREEHSAKCQASTPQNCQSSKLRKG